jgi:uncharacterized protein
MASRGAECMVFQSHPIAQLLVKVAGRCNIDCSYCYWFRDASVYNKPKLMSAEVLHQLLRRVEEHVLNYAFVEFPLTLHGGEPLLWGIDNSIGLQRAARRYRRGLRIPGMVISRSR